MGTSKFYEQIKNSAQEREVEDVYNKGINLYISKEISHPFLCDGLVDTKTEVGKVLKLIIEYKYDEDFRSKVARAKVATQVLFYLKQFEINGQILPNICLIADKNECFVFHTNVLIDFLDEQVDWNIAPSNAAAAYPDLVNKISQKESFSPFVFNVNEDFSFKSVADKIKDLADNVQRYVRITEHNISTIFEYFTSRVLKSTKGLNANDLVAVFMGVLTNKNKYYQHPSDKNLIIADGKEIQIDGNAFRSFFSFFERQYTIQESNRFTEISDRLIEDEKRRYSGEFYTPTLFVDYAHKMIEAELGEDWKNNYVVWDNCCGTKNLTRDYRFNELYCSTLEDAELQIGARYNKEATSFQFDFLNDSIDELFSTKVPKGLLTALMEKKPIVFFFNPPYATAGVQSSDSKKGVAKTKINALMLKNKIGACSQNLYAQFLYRILTICEHFHLKNCVIGVYTPTLFLSGSSWKQFREKFLKHFMFKDAIQFKASYFANVSDSWGISFSLWTMGETINKTEFKYKLLEVRDGNLVKVGEKIVYNTDVAEPANEWIKDNAKMPKVPFPHFSSGLTIKENSYQWIKGSLGYMYNKSNSVDKNPTEVALFSGIFSDAHGVSITTNNIAKCMALFAARKLIEKNWVNSKDEYLAPDENNAKYKEYVNDSVVYGIFHPSSNQSSLREIDYKGEKWNIKNEFFWMSKDELLDLANANNNIECYTDVHTDTDRYIHMYLQKVKLSAEAQAVVDMATKLTKDTFKFREMFADEHPEYQINNWDCGFYQLKALWNEFAQSEYAEFKTLFKALADKMRPMVYELGFLK